MCDRASSATPFAMLPMPTEAEPGFITGAAAVSSWFASFSTAARSAASSSGTRKTAEDERTSVRAPGSRERMTPLRAASSRSWRPPAATAASVRSDHRRDLDPRRHAVGRLAGAPDAIAVGRIQRRAAPGQRPDDLEDRWDAGTVQRQLRETLVRVVREPDLGELHLGPALELAALEDA